MFLPVALLLIAGLASDDFATRETCQEALSLCPDLAEPVVWWHYSDPEVNHRLQVVRQDYDPPWLLGYWKVSSDTGLSFSILIKPHGQAQFWYENAIFNYPNWCTWYYSEGTIMLKSSTDPTEVYRLKRGKRWTTAAVPGEIACWWTQGKKILRTRRSFTYSLNR
jgi:hypothetical protein